MCLSVGEDLARTRSLGQTLSIRSCSTWTTTHKHRQTSCCWCSFFSFPTSTHIPWLTLSLTIVTVPLPSHYGSSCWTLCHQYTGSLLQDGWYHTWSLWPWLYLCCLLSPCALWCLHADTSGWHQAPKKWNINTTVVVFLTIGEQLKQTTINTRTCCTALSLNH